MGMFESWFKGPAQEAQPQPKIAETEVEKQFFGEFDKPAELPAAEATPELGPEDEVTEEAPRPEQEAA